MSKCFGYFKAQLIKPTLLQYPDFTKEFCVITDASKQAVRTQAHNGTQLPVAYGTRVISYSLGNHKF